MNGAYNNEHMEWNLGPDNLFPAKSYTSTRLGEAVIPRNDSSKLTINKKSSKTVPTSIFTKFKETVERTPDRVALGMSLKLKL
jgi:hypothetical protein